MSQKHLQTKAKSLNSISSKTSILSEQEVLNIRQDFPVLSQSINGNPLVFLDNAASSQMPRQVIERIQKYRETDHANVHRGVHTLSQRATDDYEKAREKVQKFINARHSEEIIWTSGTTNGINLVAASLAGDYIKEGDEIIISEMEHHSNIVSWQIHCVSRGTKLKILPVDDNGELEIEKLDELITERTKLISLIHISNVLGTINPVKEVIAKAHQHNIPVLIDGAQGSAHGPVDVQDLDCDFYVFSGHKIYGPTGIGVLYGKKEWLEKMNPVSGGGDMIQTVSFEGSTWNELPYKFEAGTPNMDGAIGLGAAIDYATNIGMSTISAYEDTLLKAATEAIDEIPGVDILGRAKNKSSIISFTMGDIHPHDVGTILDYEGVAVRAGHHCAQPLMDRYQIPATTRASFAVYNTFEEIEKLAAGIRKVKEIL